MRKTKQTAAQAQQTGPLVQSVSAIQLESMEDELLKMLSEVVSISEAMTRENKRIVALGYQLNVVCRKLDMMMTA